MGEYDEIIASYLEKQANLRAQLKLLKEVAERDDQTVRSPVRAAMRRIEHEIGDLDAAISRCRAKSRQTQRSASSSAMPRGARQAGDGARQNGDGQSRVEAVTQLVFRCHKADRVIATGIEITRELFESLPAARTMRCRFCGQDHQWEAVERSPAVATRMSLRAEDFLGRAVQSDAHAANATDPAVRELYERMAGQWYQLALESEDKANGLSR
jgi:hypothetical protein